MSSSAAAGRAAHWSAGWTGHPWAGFVLATMCGLGLLAVGIAFPPPAVEKVGADDASIADTAPANDDADDAQSVHWTVSVPPDQQGARLRSEPSVLAPIVEYVADGSRVTDLGEQAQDGERVFHHVATAGGRTGWMNAIFLVPDPADSEPADDSDQS